MTYQFVSSLACDAPAADAAVFKQQFAAAIGVDPAKVTVTITCGSLIVDFSVITETAHEVSAVQTRLSTYLNTATQATNVFSLPVERVATALTTVAVDAPPSAPPPPTHEVCGCIVLLDGLSTQSELCVRRTTGVCKPVYGGCPSDMDLCTSSTPPCEDDPGRWRMRKCPKKSHKCHKKKMKRKCRKTCNNC